MSAPAAVSQPTGRLVLVPTPLDHGCAVQTPLDQVLPLGTLQVAATLTHWICENAKSARAFLKRVDALVPLAQPIQAQQFTELPRQVHKKGDHRGHAAPAEVRAWLQPALAGQSMGLLSEAGMPAVADPGSSVVRAAHELGLPVQPLVGPVSPLLALAASGLNGQDFAFIGYLPQDAQARAARIRELQAHAVRTGQTQLLIETPYRNAAVLRALIDTLAPQLRLAVAAGLTLPDAQVRSHSVAAWRRLPTQDLAPATPAIFLFGP